MRAMIFGVAGASLFAMLVSISSVQADTFAYSGSVVGYTVPTTGIYAISASGAQGGESYEYYGGSGAVIGGNILLNAGTQLEIAVGGEGGFSDYAGSGGGGSFVYVQNASQPLLVAGGGGGAGFAAGVSGGLTGTSGQAGFGAGGGTAGTGGSGGGGATDSINAYNGGGGGGWLSLGGNGLGSSANIGDGGMGPPGFAGGLSGAGADYYGGFGGGGGAGAYGGGGGGGYSGGGGGDGDTYGGGGGGSYLDPTFTSTSLQAGANGGNGSVTIQLIEATPEPGTLALLGSALLGLGVAYLRQRRANG